MRRLAFPEESGGGLRNPVLGGVEAVDLFAGFGSAAGAIAMAALFAWLDGAGDSDPLIFLADPVTYAALNYHNATSRFSSEPARVRAFGVP